MIKTYKMNEEDRWLLAIAKGRLKRLKEGKSKLISHKNAWKSRKKNLTKL